MITRPAIAGDVPAIARIHVDSWRATYRGILPAGFLDGLDVGALAEHWDRRVRGEPDDVLVVCSPDDMVTGFARLTGCADGPDLAGFAGEVSMLYLAPPAVGCGLGAGLWRACVDALAGRGYRWLVVWVLAANHHARAFYRSRGLRADGAWRVDLFDGQPVDVIRYASALNPVVDMAALIAQTA